MMTQNELFEQLALVHDCFRVIHHRAMLLDIASKLGDDFSEDNFDKIVLLVDCFKQSLDCELGQLNSTLNRLEDYLDSVKQVQ